MRAKKKKKMYLCGAVFEKPLGKFDSYKLDLTSLPAGASERSFLLNNDFFAHIEAEEVQKGKLKADVAIHTRASSFELNFTIEGIAIVSCDRCLDDMELPVSTTGRLVVKFGKEFAEEGDDIVIIPEEEGSINLAWFLYEFVALSIPLKHVHLPGKCNKDMSTKLKKHSAKSGDDEFEMDDIVETDNSGDAETADPRWDALKDLKED
jgi:uncharacterized metal-binding protein YceD (DUF177 family)